MTEAPAVESGGSSSVRAMGHLRGIPASEGVGIGTVRALASAVVVRERKIFSGDVASELHRFEEAVAATDLRLAAIGQELQSQGQQEGHLILEAHRLVLGSDRLVRAVRELILNDLSAAECAVRRVVDRLAAAFHQMRDPYLRERSGDIEAVGERLLAALLGLPEAGAALRGDAGCIGVAATLSPIDALQLGRAELGGVVTERGGRTSHAAIILRALKVPYVFGVHGLREAVSPGDTLIVDGASGEVVVNPDEATLAAFRERGRWQLERARRLRARPTGVTRTADGVRFELGANLDALTDTAQAVEVRADSAGLVRTELLYLERTDLPSEDEQFQDAVAVLAALEGRPATFRTLDVGGDKLPLSLQVPQGANPSLGVRAIRFSLLRPDIFRTQLRALFRASARGPLRIMFPLVSSVSELRAARVHCKEVQEALRHEGLPFREDTPIGAMLETPSAVLTVDHLAAHCDFFSVGTNDLVQYAFAADRDNDDVAALSSPLHPAMLRLLKLAVDGAAAAGRGLSVCGDMAANPAFTWLLLGLGVRELSMAPQALPAVRSVVAGTRLAEAEALAAGALACRSVEEVEALVSGAMGPRFPLELGLRAYLERAPARSAREAEATTAVVAP